MCCIIQIFFSSRSLGLFHYVTDMICGGKSSNNITVNARLTRHDEITYIPVDDGQKTRDAAMGRASFQEILETAPDSAHVYFCGSPFIQSMIQTICTKRCLTYHKGHSFHSK